MNRKWLVLFLALLLCGCQKQQTPVDISGVSVPAIAVTEPTEPVGFYDSENPVEAATAGAVKAYPLPMADASGIRFLGKDILLFSGDEITTLTLLSGESRYIKAQLQLSCALQPDDATVVVDARGIVYVDHANRVLITLNDRLEEISRFPLPENCKTAALSTDRRLLYYCTGDALRVLNLDTGLDKLLREMSFPSQELTAIHCDDTLLQCHVRYADGSQHVLFLAADTGALLFDSTEDIPLWTSGDFYVAFRMDGYFSQWLTGTGDSDPQVLVLEQEPDMVIPIPQLQSVLTYCTEQEHSAVLECYELKSGSKTARQTVPGLSDPRSPQYDPDTDTLWFLSGEDVLYAWDLKASAVSEEEYRLQTRWTQTNPDAEGLAQCSLLARQISIKHDVNVLIWTDATVTQPWDYTLTPEYQVLLLRRRLEELDAMLACYPEGFLAKSAAGTGFGRLTICLVRSIDGNGEAGALDHAMGLQFWDQEERAYLAITVGPDMTQHLHHELFHMIDTRVLSACNLYDDWNKLNPKNFFYDAQYTSSRSEEGRAYLSPEKRYFTDLYAMTYPKEDRARVMEYAMLDGQEALFQATPMQAKLRKLCLGIREAFGLKNEPVSYRWEQYLDTPLNPSP